MMKKRTPVTTSDATLRAWFAKAGIAVEAVDRCPEPTCERCGKALERAA